MPYIRKSRRQAIRQEGAMAINNVGELNFFITEVILGYLQRYAEVHVDKKNFYPEYNEVIGVLECIKQELYRRMIVPYEEMCKEERGDVF